MRFRVECVMPHLITSSARARRDGGTVRPSALAVGRLITSSEGPLWVYTSAARGWMPFVLQPDDTLSFYDEYCNKRAEFVLRDIPGEKAIDLFLKYWCSLEPRAVNRP